MTEPADPHLDMDLPAIPVVQPHARTLGGQLRNARETHGLALADIAARTRIPERTLVAIEADAYDQLPHPTFAAGFIRSLAREVGLNEEEATQRYRAENTRLAPIPTAPPLRPIEPERVPSRRLAWISGGVAALVIVGALVWFGRDHGTPPTPAPTVVASTADNAIAPAGIGGPATSVAPPDTSATSAAAAPLAVLGTPGGAVTLTATQDVWIQIKDKAAGTRLMSGILTQGQTYAVPPGDLQLWTGRAGALQVRVNGRLLPLLGGVAETVRAVDLSPAALVARAAGAPADAGATMPSAGAR